MSPHHRERDHAKDEQPQHAPVVVWMVESAALGAAGDQHR
jgi:hypothetical protein